MPISIISENLARFGFSGYESKAFIALIKKNPVTGYELAKNSGIPPSKIYEVIKKLLDKNIQYTLRVCILLNRVKNELKFYNI